MDFVEGVRAGLWLKYSYPLTFLVKHFENWNPNFGICLFFFFLLYYFILSMANLNLIYDQSETKMPLKHSICKVDMAVAGLLFEYQDA